MSFSRFSYLITAFGGTPYLLLDRLSYCPVIHLILKIEAAGSPELFVPTQKVNAKYFY